ncbi:MAG TPA: carboxypeptidase-like regulatory domain-containing protein [Thermoanaerobaculia bacterium]|nr:carboxypeptidase-like regulatory domain-containing protein [Thermoanaerobaculia bacterium]
MRKVTALAVLAILLPCGAAEAAEVRLSDVIHVLGDVTESARPVEDALVVAFNLSSSYIIQTFSGEKGKFRLPPLPSGVYRIIAVKEGFAPAVATVTPSRNGGRELALRLGAARDLTAAQRDAVWQVRRAIPSDILRELGIVDESMDLAAQAVDLPRFSGEMVSMTGVSHGGEAAGFSRTGLGVRGAIGSGWMLDVSGTLRTMDQEPAFFSSTDSFAESAGVSMEIRSTDSARYRIDSNRNSWMLQSPAGPVRSADFEAHNLQWERLGANVQLRYMTHENMFGPAQLGSELMEVAAQSRILKGERGELGIGIRVGQESVVGNSLGVPFRTADVTTRGTWDLARSFELQYGLNSRITEFGEAWEPETGLLVRVSPSVAIVFSGAYKIDDQDQPQVYPTLAFLDQPWRFAPRYRYGVSLTGGSSDQSRLLATASVSEIDAVMRLVFDDQFEEFWDAFYLEPGDVYQSASLTVQKHLTRSLAVDVATRAGQASARHQEGGAKHYLAGSVQSLYIPSGTALHVAWRFIEQPDVDSAVAMQESERINLRLAQSLGLPLGLRLLLGLDLARSMNSSVLADGDEIDGYHQRLVGGLSLAF